jgi:hypothetical protein
VRAQWSRVAMTTVAMLVLGVLVTVPAGPASGAFPQTAPNDPGYSGQTYLFDHIPSTSPLAHDPEGSSGMWVDRAWRDYTAGTPDTVIAYVEGGINWHDASALDLVNKVYLNRGELPVPCAGSPCTTRFGATLADYDVNHDGAFNVRDYAGDPRVTDQNGNGYVDAEDLIALFSDHTDRDHNGYVDDISGWDFYNRQNDPSTLDAAYTHANSQMRQAAAEVNNGYLGAGVCPRCMILPVKAGAEALDRTDDLAQAWLFAADSGAAVIVSVTADLGYSTFMKQAINSIWRRGVVMVEASNDFDSTDHQGGMYWPHVLPGNGLVADTEGLPNGAALATTFRERSNYTSWGTHNMFSVATSGGTTSESTPTVGGVAALVMAYGKVAAQQHRLASPLTNAEVIQVLRATTSDIADPTLPWPGKPGFDLQYGYGRPNVWKAMRAVQTGAVPPVAWFNSPDWYSLYDPVHTTSVAVSGHVGATRSSNYTWKLEFAPGAEPADASFTTTATGAGTQPFDGTLGNIDLTQVPSSFWNAAFHLSSTKSLETNEQYTVTLRLRVTDAAGRVGEERRAIAVHHDPSLLGGAAKRIGHGGESQPALADLQGSGRLDIVFGDSDGLVHALDPRTFQELPGWPVHTKPTTVVKSHAGIAPGYEPVVGNVAVGDLVHNGTLQVVATSTTGNVYVFNADGTARAGWPRALNLYVTPPPIPRPALPFTRLPARGAVASPVLADLNHNGTLEIVQAAWDGYVHVFRTDGSDMPGWPQPVTEAGLRPVDPGYSRVHDHKLDTLPVVADIDGDGLPEIVVRSQYTDVTGSGISFNAKAHMYAFHADGGGVAGWPNTFVTTAEFYGSAQEFVTEGAANPVAADAIPGGGLEIACGGAFGPNYLFAGDGSVITAYGGATDVPVTLTTSGAFGNISGVGLGYAQPGSDGTSLIQALLRPGSGEPIKNLERAYTAAGGVLLPGFPAAMQGLDFLGGPIITDVTGDGLAEVVNSGDSSALHGYGIGGLQVAGFPKFFTGWSLWAPSAGDLLSNGRTNIVATSREGYLFAWTTPGLASANHEWWHANHDDRNTGTYGVDARPPGSIRNLQWPLHGSVASFVAPGDDWYTGTVSRYRVTFGPSSSATVVAPTGAAGSVQTLAVPSGTTSITVQAVDDAANLSRAATAS